VRLHKDFKVAHKVQEISSLQRCVIQYNKLSNCHEELWMTGRGGGGCWPPVVSIVSIRLDAQEEKRK